MSPDLSKELTVFILSTGEWTLPDCERLLLAQDCTFQIKHITNTTPMWCAFQRLLDECETPYFVQVDADMLLNSDAVRRLHLAIASAPQDVAFVSGYLWDIDTGRNIHGVKVYRHQICARYPYQESRSCEVDQFGRMEKDGYRWAPLDKKFAVPEAACLGRHHACWSPEAAFRRWKNLTEKFRIADQVTWIAAHVKEFFRDAVADPTNEIKMWRLFGAIAGLSGPRPEAVEYDASKPDQTFRRLSPLFGAESKGPSEVSLYLTDQCNFKCEFDGVPCMREAGPGASHGDGVPHNGTMELWRVRDILKAFPTIKGACIAGFGEPMMHPQLGELIDLLHVHGVYVGIITNGSLLLSKKDVLESRLEKIGYISVSLNAVDAESHQEMSKTKTWEKVLNGIRHFAQLPVLLGATFVCGKQGLDEVPRALALCNDLGSKFIHFHNPLPHNGLDLQFRTSVIKTSDVEALRRIDEFKRLPGAGIVKTWPVPIAADYSGAPQKCRSPFVSIGVDASGGISTCRRVTPPSLDEGGIYWPDLWQGTAYWRQRFELTGDRDPPDKCRGCFGNQKE